MRVQVAEVALLAAQQRGKAQESAVAEAQRGLDAAYGAQRQLDGRRQQAEAARKQAEAAWKQAEALNRQAEMEQGR